MSFSQIRPTEVTRPTNVLRVLIFVIGATMTLFTLYYAWQLPLQEVRYANIFLGLGLTLFYLVEAQKHLTGEEVKDVPDVDDSPDAPVAEASEAVDGPLWLDDRNRVPGINYWDRIGSAYGRATPAICILLAMASAIATGYVEFHFDRLLHEARMIGWTQNDLIIGIVIIAVVTEATGRAYGKTIAAVVLGSVLYATTFIGANLPGLFRHTGMNWEQISREGAIALTGTYGFILVVGSTWVAVFIMFAGMAKAFGLMTFIIEVSQEIRKVLKSGVVHIAIVASMAMGSITGSAAANTATTGSFTIPMMQDQGIRGDFAAAIESFASSGGQILPPVMGVAAFLMADILGVSYFLIIQAAFIPAVLFYFGAMFAAHMFVLKHGWTATATGEFDRSLLLKGIHFIVPIVVLIYTLVIMRLTPLGAGFYTILTLVATMYVRNAIVDGLSVGTLFDTTKQTAIGLKQGAVEMAPLVGILASLGVVINMLTQTGLTQKISAQMIALSAGIFVILLLLAMIASILFGLGMPTPAAYILVVVLVAPAMIQFGVQEITAHMYVFYFAILSAITPPVAISVAIGSKIAGAGFLVSCKQALRIGAPGFLIPFAFIANDSLIYWAFPDTLIATGIVIVGVAGIVISMTGFDGWSDLGLPRRTIFFVLGLVAMMGPFVAQVAAVAIIVALVSTAYVRSTPRAEPVADD